MADEPHTIAVITASDAALSASKSMTAEELNLIFWRKKLYWQGGVPIHPVNLQAEHPIRLTFSKTVLGNSPTEQTNYWNGLYFHGISPPYSVQSEEAVLRYVANTKGAIGYVDACKVDDRVKALLWISNTKISATAPEKMNCVTTP
jgi:ABC-type phosphate transport system substrate-binding protein